MKTFADQMKLKSHTTSFVILARALQNMFDFGAVTSIDKIRAIVNKRYLILEDVGGNTSKDLSSPAYVMCDLCHRLN